MKFTVAPSILAADFACLTKEIEKIYKIPDSQVHLDVMDGHFVPNISIGPGVVKKLRKTTNLPFDVHLMIDNPENFFSQFKDAGANYITFHIEQTRDPMALINKIKELGIKPGISIKPSTNLDKIEHLLSQIDVLLIMSVEPGFSGQKFINSSLTKIEKARKTKESKKLNFQISVDGGINDETAETVIKAGADILVMGNYFFENPFELVKSAIEKLREK
ncbi:MAG: ribulose-phosphate 3-epimerase [Caldisericota bacterium]|nr:ribulose-phosphate 3-epimerase [Caldisericota bacterium]